MMPPLTAPMAPASGESDHGNTCGGGNRPNQHAGARADEHPRPTHSSTGGEGRRVARKILVRGEIRLVDDKAHVIPFVTDRV